MKETTRRTTEKELLEGRMAEVGIRILCSLPSDKRWEVDGCLSSEEYAEEE
jgi:hypothetical protein